MATLRRTPRRGTSTPGLTMSLRLVLGKILPAGAVAALLALSACGEDQRSLISPEEQAQEFVLSILRAELPNNNEYTLRVRNLPAPAVDTFTNIPRFSTAQMDRAADGTLWTVTQGRVSAGTADTARVLRIDPSGAVTIRATLYRGLRGCAVDSQGTLYLSSNTLGEVYRLQTDSTVTKLATGLMAPFQLALSPDESTLYATSSGDNRILEITLNPLSVATLQTDTPIFAPRTLTFDDMGRMYVGSHTNTTIVRVDLNAAPKGGSYPVETIGQIPETNVGTMIWNAGTLYVSGGSRIYRIPDGGDTFNYTGSRLGGRTDADPGSLAQFVNPLGMAFDPASGVIYVADSGPNSAVRRVLPGQSQESAEWLPEYADREVYRVVPAAWAFGLGSGQRIDIPASERGASVGSVAVGISEDRLSIFGLRDHEVWVQLDVYRLL
jgi:sugar lactone lactonase YvrE